MTAIELNNKANTEFTNLTQHNLFNELEAIEQSIKNSKNPFDIAFYLSQEDKLTAIFGELQNSFGELQAELEKYLAGRKLQIICELSKNKGEFTVNNEKVKVTATLLNSVLGSLIRGEVDDLYKTVLLLESKIKRVQNSTQTCRNHCYAKKNVEKEN